MVSGLACCLRRVGYFSQRTIWALGALLQESEDGSGYRQGSIDRPDSPYSFTESPSLLIMPSHSTSNPYDPTPPIYEVIMMTSAF